MVHNLFRGTNFLWYAAIAYQLLLLKSFNEKLTFEQKEEEGKLHFVYDDGNYLSKEIPIEETIISAISICDTCAYIDSAVEINGYVRIVTSEFVKELKRFEFIARSSYVEFDKEIEESHKDYLLN